MKFPWKRLPRTQQLTTPFEEADCPAWGEEHPRPQMKRTVWQSLCGPWELSRESNGRITPVGTITVPFPPESRLSGIGRTLEKGEKWHYRREFEWNRSLERKRVLLHFGAVDQIARVFLNGHQLGEHVGGYLPFTLDLTAHLQSGRNTLSVEVTDELDLDLPYGKQRRDRGGMWYTPITGIWQTVWLEEVPVTYIHSLRITPTLDSVTIDTTGGEQEKYLTLKTPSGPREYRWSGDTFTIPVEEPVLWTPEQPHLYPFVLEAGEDKVESYFALRTVTVEKHNGQAYLCLNGKPRFFHGLLDQGYFSDGIYLPASPEGYRFDIRTAKSMGFDVLRKHIKVEPDLFYHYCDKYGMLIFQDMVNAGPYHYIIDTVLPTLGMHRGVTHRPSDRRREQFEKDVRCTVKLLYNHPCVCLYTIFNEGWGQYEADRLYGEMKDLDPAHIWNATSGWFKEQDSDVDSDHIYFRPADLTARPERPLLLTEFGGYSYKLPDHSFNLDQTYGYKKFDDPAAFAQALEAMYRQEITPSIGRGLCGAVLTQLSDVEDETNGLLTYDRRVVKVSPEAMMALAKDLRDAFRSHLNE